MAIKIVLSEGMPLEKLGKWLEIKSKTNKWFDAFICPWCTALQSITAHAFAFGLGILPLELNLHLFLRWALVIMASSFVSGNLWNLYETVNRIKDRNEVEKDFLERATEAAEVFITNCTSEFEDEEEFEDRVFNNQHN